MRTSKGIAIVVVLLVGGVAILAMLFASATLSATSRLAASSERNSTQALLAADSGLNTLKARAAAVGYESGTFTDWIASNLSTLNLGGGVTAAITVVEETTERVTVQSVGRFGNSTRTVVQDFAIVRGLPLPISTSIPAALTSVGSIKSNSGSARVNGRPNTDSAWTTTQVPIIDKSKTEYRPAVLCDAIVGEYADVGGVVYRVDGPIDCMGMIQVTNVSTGVNQTLAGSTQAGIRVTAITESLQVSNGQSIVNVTPGTIHLFGIGSPISIGGSSRGTVVDIDGTRLTIEWEVTPPLPQPEGSIVRREIVSGVSMGTCPTGNNVEKSFPHGCTPNVDLSNLFYKTFGVLSPEFLKNSLPASQRITGSEVKGRTLSGITWVTNPPNNFRDQSGSGILIIENNPGQTINLNVSNDFIGLIYVIGDADIQGNGQYQGAIIVDGSATVNTDVQGTTDINYDPMHLLRALAGIEVPNPNPGALGHPIPNTWRVR